MANGEADPADNRPLLTHGLSLFKKFTIFILAIFAIAATTTANAQHRRTHHQRAAVIVCDERGCSDQTRARNSQARAETSYASYAMDANGNSAVIGGRPAGCPRNFCGCEASRYLFGEIRAELNLASNWIRKFPRTSPAPGMAAARSGHVMILMSHVGGNDWLVHDGNSGGGLTRQHVRSISGYVVVDPNGSRSATN